MTHTQPTDAGLVAVYQTDDGGLGIEARVAAETIWLPMSDIAALFGVNTPAISKHVKNIYSTGELASAVTVSKMETVRQESQRHVTRFGLLGTDPNYFFRNLLLSSHTRRCTHE